MPKIEPRGGSEGGGFPLLKVEGAIRSTFKFPAWSPGGRTRD